MQDGPMLLNTRLAEVGTMSVGPTCLCARWAHVGGMLRGPTLSHAHRT